jgi:putative tricarboxylic transport membrane protein
LTGQKPHRGKGGKMRTLRRPARILAFALSLAAAPLAAGAQGWQPTQEVEIVAQSGTTSSVWANADLYARIINEQKLFPQGATVRIVEGARGAKARTYVAKDHAGDPHVLQILAPTQIQIPIVAQSDVNRSLFRGIAMMLVSPKLFTVNADSPYKTFDDLINAAKEKPGKVIFGGGDPGSTASLVADIMEKYFKIDLTYTPFEDQGVVELLGGHIDFIFDQPEVTTKFVKAGQMRYLAASQKLEAFPDVPTLAELGHNFEVFDSYRGVWTSKEVPDEAVAFYIDAFQKIYESDTFKKYIADNGMNPQWIAGADLDKRLDAEVESFTKIATEMGIIKK